MTLTSPLTERREHYEGEVEMSESLLDTARLEWLLQRFPWQFAGMLRMEAKVEYSLAEFRAAVDAARAK